MNQDFGKRGNCRDLAVLEIGGIQQPECTDFATEPTRSGCALTWPPSVPPSLGPNLWRQLLGAGPKNIATPGPRNCSQVRGPTCCPSSNWSLPDLLGGASSGASGVSWQRGPALGVLSGPGQAISVSKHSRTPPPCMHCIWNMFIDLQEREGYRVSKEGSGGQRWGSYSIKNTRRSCPEKPALPCHEAHLLGPSECLYTVARWPLVPTSHAGCRVYCAPRALSCF